MRPNQFMPREWVKYSTVPVSIIRWTNFSRGRNWFKDFAYFCLSEKRYSTPHLLADHRWYEGIPDRVPGIKAGSMTILWHIQPYKNNRLYVMGGEKKSDGADFQISNIFWQELVILFVSQLVVQVSEASLFSYRIVFKSLTDVFDSQRLDLAWKDDC